MEKIKCTVERVTFQNPENGYSVLQTTIKGYRDEQTVVGSFYDVSVGAILTVEGSWRIDSRYGRQFVKVDQFFPSSQLCSECGYRNQDIRGINIKKWTCPHCGSIHQRDINAGKNILREGERLTKMAEELGDEKVLSASKGVIYIDNTA